MRHFNLYAFLAMLMLASMLPASAQVFYKVEGNGLEHPSYLFGTHHLAPADFTDRFKSLPQAMEQTQAVVGEVDMTIDPMQLQMRMAPYMQAPADSTLSRLLSAEEFAVLNEKFKPLSPMPGLDLTMLDGMRPMVATTMVSLTLIQKSMPGFNPAEQIDSKFQNVFSAAGKKVIPLETPEEQAALLYDFTPITKQLEALRETLDDTSKVEQMAQQLNKAYLEQDLDKMMSISDEEEADPAFLQAMLTLRNRKWMQTIPDIMRTQPAMIVVGALHLAGSDGLVSQLKEAGYTVTPVDFD